ncbi:MAG: tRNA (adenosine(37)-N6)-dimethylallyltransferase MiaA [Proteobacteria bacterium]|nr:tRNA (adenosine(37)-N6)-dimethylallyltransferase MiaA [Pseudomonadota bacterium]HQR03695.1 tRNA (adenosine(37)-N6)-dimethylallyltransferase MiaA [Rhodocyclaceae bacterium]
MTTGNPSLPPAILLMGPTASGKTALGLEIAQRFPVELISVDSAQVFTGMDIGTAKPDAATLARFPHHLIDLITPEERYSAARFRSDALRVMEEITRRGRIPLLVGGTMLYFKALLEGLAELPEADPALRAAIDTEARTRGWPSLHAELARLDPDSGARLKPNDSQRIQRALEIVRLTGRPVGEFYARQIRQPLPYRILPLALMPGERAELHARIALRFDQMLEQGLVREVRMLQQAYALHAGLPAMRCVGYRQTWQMLAGEIPATALRDRGIFATRQLAKRQLTWLNSMGSATRHNSCNPRATDDVLQEIHQFLLPCAHAT